MNYFVSSQVVDFSPNDITHYVNITINNIVKIYKFYNNINNTFKLLGRCNIDPPTEDLLRSTHVVERPTIVAGA